MELQDFLPYQLSVLSNKISAGIAKFYRDQHGITIAQWRVLALLSNESKQSAKDLKIKSQMDKVKISRTMRSLLNKKLLSEHICKLDKRSRRYKLTKKGNKLIEQVKPKALMFEKKLIETLSQQEITIFKNCIQRLNQQADKISKEI